MPTALRQRRVRESNGRRQRRLFCLWWSRVCFALYLLRESNCNDPWTDTMRAKPATADAYLKSFSGEGRKALETVRTTIREAIPDAEESISYGIPVYLINGTYAVYFAGFKNHISLYPVLSGSESFMKKVLPYRAGKGTLRFSLKDPLPLALIAAVAKNGKKEALSRSAKRKR